MLCVALLVGGAASAQDKPPDKLPIVLGLHADMSSGSATAGEALRRGALLALSEINAQGGLLGGRQLELSDYRLTTFTPEGMLVPSQP